MRILMTGALGMVGQAVIQALLVNSREKPGWQLECFDLETKANRRVAARLGLKPIWGDIRHLDSIRAALHPDLDAVIHLAAIIPPLADRKPDLAREVNLEGTRNLLAAMAEGCPRARLVFASSVAVYGTRITNPIIRVDDPLLPAEGDYYGQLKIEAEALVRQSGLDSSILRLSWVAGPLDMVYDPILFRMPLETPVEPVMVEDVATALIQAASLPQARGRTFNIGGGIHCRTVFRAFLDRMFPIFGLGRLRDSMVHLFSAKGYHCAWFEPEDANRILDFQHHTLDDYFRRMKQSHRLSSFFLSLVAPIAWLVLARLGSRSTQA